MNRFLGRRFDGFEPEKADGEGTQLPNISETEVARHHYKLRRVRDKLFPMGYFSDAGWEILLELYLCEVDNLEISPSYLAYAAGVPPTTTLRYVSQLEADGYVERRPCDTDKRRTIMSLTDVGRSTMANIMKESAQHLRQDMERRREAQARGGTPPTDPAAG